MVEFVSYSWYQSQPRIRTQNIRIWRKIFWFSGKKRAFCPVSGFFHTSKIKYFYIFGMYTKRRSQRWVAGRRKPPHAPPRAPRATRLHGASDSRAWLVRSTRQLLQRIADVIDDVSLPSQQRAVSGADVLMTWLLARLLTWRMTSACHVTQPTVMGDDVAMTWLSTCLLTSALAKPVLTRPGQRSTGSRVNSTRSTGQPGQWSTGSTRPGHRSTRSTVNRVNRVKPDPVNTTQPCPRVATRLPTRRTFWWRVRARGWVFFGDFDTYRFVSKLSTIWYIDLAYLKLLQT